VAKKKRTFKRKALKLALIASAIAAIGAGLFFIWFFQAYPIGKLKTHYPQVQWSKKQKQYVVILSKSKPWSWVKIDDVSTYAIGAVVVSEDWKFFEHSGIDFSELSKAMKINFRKKRYARGASTISQQVIKNVFLNRDKTLWRKFKELLLTLQLEKRYSKRKILEIYFNVVEWGQGIYGVKAASGYYFSKHPSLLGAKESAFLAMLLPSPKRYSESFRQQELTPYAKETIEDILKKMVQAGYLEEDTIKPPEQEPLSFERRQKSLRRALF
jgi:monofunctional biosynthetic peptidoglycan transglycosylase